MMTALWLLAIQGAIGAFDTLYFHEYRARLPARWRQTHVELKIHAVRDFLYAVLFSSLPFVAWWGAWTWVLAAILAAEIALTFTDFAIEPAARRGFGDVLPGERVTHSVMGIIYGGMLAHLVPELLAWSRMPTGFAASDAPLPEVLRWTLLAMGAGVLLSGIRDLSAAFGLPLGGWPWREEAPTR